MAIQIRRGDYTNLDADQMLPGEIALVMSGEPDTNDGKSVYMCTGAKEIKRFAMSEDLSELKSESDKAYAPLPQEEEAPDFGNEGQVLRTNGDGTTFWGKAIEEIVPQSITSDKIADKNVTLEKLSGEAIEILQDGQENIRTEYTHIYNAVPGYFGGYGSYGTKYIPISGAKSIHAESTISRICWYAYKKEGNITYVTDIWLLASMGKNKDGKYVFDLNLYELITSGVDSISIGFYGQNFDKSAQEIKLYYNNHEQDKYIQNELITKEDKVTDMLYYQNSGYSGDLFELLGASKDWFKGNDGDGYIDVSESKTLYAKYPISAFINGFTPVFYCFDGNKTPLYSSTDEFSGVICNVRSSISGKPSMSGSPAEYVGVADDGTNIAQIYIYEITFPDEVKYVAYVPNLNNSSFKNQVLYLDSLFLIWKTPIDDYWSTYDDYASRATDRFKNLVEEISGAKEDPEEETNKRVLFIGDSLTNWGGGNDAQDGFLKIVHEKTGVLTTNQGYAGATWQDSDSQQYSGVDRINTLTSSGAKYDMYVFILGTNGGSAIDTGETSLDTSTMSGAIRYCLEKLKAYEPTKPILVCLPPQRAEGNENQEKVNEVIKSIANSYSVKTLDLYHESGIVPNTKIANIGYLSDGLHLSLNGYTVLGNLLASEIKYALCI